MNICTNLILTQLVQIDTNKVSTFRIFTYPYVYWISIKRVNIIIPTFPVKVNGNMNIATYWILTLLFQIDANKASTYWILTYSYAYWLSIEGELNIILFYSVDDIRNMNICTNLIITHLVQIDANKVSTYWICIYPYAYWISIRSQLIYHTNLFNAHSSKYEHMYKPNTYSIGSDWCQQGEYLLNIPLFLWILIINWDRINI